MAFSLSDIVTALGGDRRGDDVRITRLAALETATTGDLVFVTSPKHLAALQGCGASAAIVKPAMAEHLSLPLITTDNPQLYFTRLAHIFYPMPAVRAGRHPSAVVEATAHVDPSAELAAHVVIAAGAMIGARVRVLAGAVIEAGAMIGDDTVVHPRVVVHHGCVVGQRCILHVGCVIGSDGFGNAWAGDHWEKIPQIGRAVVGDDVEIGTNTTIDRGALVDTVIEDGVRPDNLIHVAHNCRIGRHTAIAACVGIAGSTTIGAYCQVGGAAMISGHLTIGDRVVISGGTVVAKSLATPGHYTAVYPIAPHRDWLTNAAHLRQLDKLVTRVKALELGALPSTPPKAPL